MVKGIVIVDGDSGQPIGGAVLRKEEDQQTAESVGMPSWALKTFLELVEKGQLRYSVNIAKTLELIRKNTGSSRILILGSDLKGRKWEITGGYEVHTMRFTPSIKEKGIYYIIFLDKDEKPEEVYERFGNVERNEEYQRRIEGSFEVVDGMIFIKNPENLREAIELLYSMLKEG